MADFIAEWTPEQQPENMCEEAKVWTAYCDGTWGASRAGASAIIHSPSKIKTKYAVRLQFKCTNNIAEYEALLLAVMKRVHIKTNSKVIAGHIE